MDNFKHHVSSPIYTAVIAWVLLLPLLFFVVGGTFSFDRSQSGNLGTTESNNLTATRSDSTYYKMEQAVLYLIIVGSMVPSIPILRSAFRKNKFIFLLPCLALLSAFWSQSLSKTIPFGVFAILLTAFGVYLTQRFPHERQISLFLFVGWATILLSFVAILFFPAAGIWNADGEGAWRGMFIHKNHMGSLASLLGYAAFCSKPRNALQWSNCALYLILTVVLIVGSQSRTAWIVFALSLCFIGYATVYQKFRVTERFLFIVLTAISLSVLAAVAYIYTAQIAVALGKDPTLTGRTKIWAAVGTVLWKRPLLGYGYNAFWLGLNGESANLLFAVGATSLGNSENGVLEIWLELGIVGVIIALLTIFQSCRNALICFKLGAPRYVYWYVLIIFFIVLSLFTGGKIMKPHTIDWLLFVMAYVGLSTEARRIREQGAQ